MHYILPLISFKMWMWMALLATIHRMWFVHQGILCAVHACSKDTHKFKYFQQILWANGFGYDAEAHLNSFACWWWLLLVQKGCEKYKVLFCVLRAIVWDRVTYVSTDNSVAGINGKLKMLSTLKVCECLCEREPETRNWFWVIHSRSILTLICLRELIWRA